jgi:nucleoside-diphosphate-sugar epimerase
MRVAVVGATGLLGRAHVPLLLEHDHVVLALARSPAKASEVLPPKADILPGDLLSPGSETHLSRLLEGVDAVFHIATAIPADPDTPGAWDVNTRLRTDGTRTLLQAALKAGVKRYIQQSITMAYPDRGETWITEGTALDTSPGRASLCGPVIGMEGLVRSLAGQAMQSCILRGGGFVGPGTGQERVMAELRAGQLVVEGSGRNFTSKIHVADMAAACLAALQAAPSGSVFNIVADPIRYSEYLDRLADALGVPHPQRESRLPTPPSWRCSNELARNVLGWGPKHSIIPTI